MFLFLCLNLWVILYYTVKNLKIRAIWVALILIVEETLSIEVHSTQSNMAYWLHFQIDFKQIKYDKDIWMYSEHSKSNSEAVLCFVFIHFITVLVFCVLLHCYVLLYKMLYVIVPFTIYTHPKISVKLTIFSYPSLLLLIVQVLRRLTDPRINFS